MGSSLELVGSALSVCGWAKIVSVVCGSRGQVKIFVVVAVVVVGDTINLCCAGGFALLLFPSTYLTVGEGGACIDLHGNTQHLDFDVKCIVTITNG